MHAHRWTAEWLAWISRRYRYSRHPLDVLGRAAGRGVRNLTPHVSDPDVPYVDINGYKRYADLHDHMELESFLGLRRLDASVTAVIQAGDWVMDVGANIGLITAQLARHVGKSGRVWAIEPIPRNQRRLHQLADDNNLAQMRIVEGALSNQTGQAEIRLPAQGQSGWASFTKSWDMGASVTTPTWRLDELVAGQEGRISFIKLDVEGFEPQVLIGATQTLSSMRPHVMCEFNDILLRDAGSSSAQLLKLFSELGYEPSPQLGLGSSHLDGEVVDLLLSPVPAPLPAAESTVRPIAAT